MVEVFSSLKLFLCRARSTDQHTLEPVEEILLCEENCTGPLTNLGIEFINRNLAESLEPGARLTSLPLLSRDG